MDASPGKSPIKVVSFDAEGTLVTPDFSTGMWHECIPEYYGKKKGLSFDEARDAVAREYDRVGDGRLEWYDVRYWFKRFDLGDYREAFNRCKCKKQFYPEVGEVLNAVAPHYRLIVLSASASEFLEHLLAGIEGNFEVVRSSISDYGKLKTPDFYLEVCGELGVLPGEVMHVGDNRRFDFLNAREAGLQAVHLDRNNSHSGPDTVKSLTEFGELVLNSRPA